MIKLFVFDLGGVILPFEHRQIAFRLHERSAIRDRITAHEIFEFLFDRAHGLVNPYEEGKITSNEFFEHLRNKFHLQITFDDFKEIWNPIFWENKEVKNLIETLKSNGNTIFLLSNTNELHFSYIKDTYPVIHLMDRWILSYQIGAKKPKKEIYEAVLASSDVSPDEIFYVDDVREYVEVARNLGMKGFVFTDAPSLRRFMESNGVRL